MFRLSCVIDCYIGFIRTFISIKHRKQSLNNIRALTQWTKEIWDQSQWPVPFWLAYISKVWMQEMIAQFEGRVLSPFSIFAWFIPFKGAVRCHLFLLRMIKKWVFGIVWDCMRVDHNIGAGEGWSDLVTTVSPGPTTGVWWVYN